MSLNLSEYYKIINGESSLQEGVWHIDYNKKHAFSVYSDREVLDAYENKISLPPSEEETATINLFSDKLGQKLKNTKIVNNGDGTESVELELEDRIVTIVLDQSGSMTWNDNNNFRHDIASDLVEKIDINYPGNITYNLVEYGADIVNVLFFAVIEEDGIDVNDIDSISKMIKADGKANYDGIRIIRNDSHYPTSIVDGELVDDGFLSRVLDEDLTENNTYYYTVYTYDKDLRFSEGIRIKSTPRERIIPRATSSFKTFADSEDITKGTPLKGSGINRDDNTVGIWHADEGEGKYLYDFSDSAAVLEFNKENPTWYESRFVPSGSSGLFLDGERDIITRDGDSSLFLSNGESTTVCAWIYPYDVTSTSYIVCSGRDSLYSFVFYIRSSSLYCLQYDGNGYIRLAISETVLETYKWQHVCAVMDGVDNKIYINGVDQTNAQLSPVNPHSFSGDYAFTIGAYRLAGGAANKYYNGKITEISIHNTARDQTYIQEQLKTSSIYDGDNNQIDTEITGLKDDNGDRLVLLEYNVPQDYNFSGGEIIIVKNEEHPPSWEEDGTIIHQENSFDGQFFVSDSDDFVLGDTYYYRLFSKNSLGNVSFLSDSPLLSVEIPLSDTEDHFLSFSEIESPLAPDIGQLITGGNEKAYLRWKQSTPLDSTIARVRVFYSSSDYPTVSKEGGSDGELVFSGLPTQEKFVHRNLQNDRNAFYTIVNVDKYGRSSNYNSDGDQVENFLHAHVIPTSTSDEGTIPLVEVDNINYEVVDNNSITIGWDPPVKSPDNIDAYFDQIVIAYASITDEYGDPIPDDTLVKVNIVSNINRESQAEDVFTNTSPTEFEDIDAYDFFVTKAEAGFYKATLRMTTDRDIISQISDASFTIQLQALLPKEGGYSPPNTISAATDPLTEYAEAIEDAIDAIDGTETEVSSGSGENIFEYYSQEIKINFTNPWEIELENRDSQKVPQRCYLYRTINEFTERQQLDPVDVFFNGVYMKASAPFVARAKVKYKGEPIEAGDMEVAVWDADSSELCRGVSEENITPYEGDKIQPSQSVLSPSSTLSIVQGVEETFKGSGVYIPISYVDIPLYAPDLPQAVRLYVKGRQSSYSSVKDLYILFQSILRIELEASAPNIDDRETREQKAEIFIINPDYPNYQINEYDKSLVTLPSDLTKVEWKIKYIQSGDQDEDEDDNNNRNIYSIDNVPVIDVPVIDGVYSYTRNGVARNVFLGPIPKEDKAIEETHELSASVVYEGLTDTAKQTIELQYNPNRYATLEGRFLMEVDGGWRGVVPNQTWGGGGWLNSDIPKNLLWADGSHYKRIKISRDPRIAEDGSGTDQFASADCFRTCDPLDYFLSSGQIVNIIADGLLGIPGEIGGVDQEGNPNVEILHGEIIEEDDPYTGEHTIKLGENGYKDYGTASIELNSEEVSDTTYFYIRVNDFIPDAKRIDNPECDKETVINQCTCLNSGDGITECDLPKWNKVIYISGETSILVNNQPVRLTGGGGFSNGIPPCPIGINEPLTMSVVWRKVTNYFYSETLGDPSNNFILPVVTDAQDNNFDDDDGVTLIQHNSDVDIRVRVNWKGGVLPDGSAVFVSVGNNNSDTLFVASQSTYYTESDEGYSYVDIKLAARRPVEQTTTEIIEIYSEYDEAEKTSRHVGETFNLTLDKKEDVIGIPELPVPDEPSAVESEPKITTPYSATVERYDIENNQWDTVANMAEARGNCFSGVVGDKVYCMGGLLNNSLNISNINEEYDTIENEWSQSSVMPNPRFAGMSVTVGNNIYTIGGIYPEDIVGGKLSVTSLLEVYHVDTDTWEELSSMPTIEEVDGSEEELGVAFGNATLVEIFNGSDIENYIYIMGGIQRISVEAGDDLFTVDKYNQRILRYSIEKDEWDYSDILRTNELSTYERISPLSILYDNKIIVFGGAIENNDNNFIYPLEDFYIDVLEDFNTPSSGEWINFGSGLMGDFPVNKYQSAMVKYDINPSATDIALAYYILGGANSNAMNLDILEKITVSSNPFAYESSYDESTSPSSSISNNLSSLLVGKHGANAEYALVDGISYIYLMGGYTINQPDSFVDISFDI
jgi:hypothetical protein